MTTNSDVPDGSTLSLEALLTASPYLFCALDPKGTLRTVNAAAESMFGYSQQELDGQSLLTLLHQDDRLRASRAIADAREAAEGPVTIRIESSAGHLRKLDLWFSHDPGADLVVIWGSDVTESHAIRDELRMRIELLERIVEERTQDVAELQTLFEDLRQIALGDPAPRESLPVSPPRAPGLRSTILSRRIPASLRAKGGLWHRSGPPPRMTMERFEPTLSTSPESGSSPEPRTRGRHTR